MWANLALILNCALRSYIEPIMSTLDVTQLAGETMPADAFPAPLKADFRAFFEPDVHRAVHAHASENTRVEICGVLVGEWRKDDNGPFASISNFIRCDNASSEMTEVTFTHDSWSHINNEMDSKYTDKRIIGWYHSHPDFGIFLSDRDVFIQEHFFSGAGQVALVVDPVRKLEGVFEWRAGKPELMKHYWVGGNIHTIAESRSLTSAERKAAAQPAGSSSMHAANTDAAMLQPGPRQPDRLNPSITTMLAWLCLFLLGYLLAGYRSSWEQELMQTGAVAHYGLFNISAYGLSDNLKSTTSQVGAIKNEVMTLAQEHLDKLEGEDKKTAHKRWLAVSDSLKKSHSTLEFLTRNFGLTDEQRLVQAAVIRQKLGEMYGIHELQRVLPADFPKELIPQLPTPEKSTKGDDATTQDKAKTKTSEGRKSSSGSTGTAQPKDVKADESKPTSKPSPSTQKPAGPAGPPGTSS